MAEFDPALQYVLNYEDAPRRFNVAIDNNGGKVIAGINSKSFPVDVALIESAPQMQRESLVAAFYRSKLFVPMMLGGLESQDVANRVMDMETNAGEPAAAPELQRAINNSGGSVTVDGRVGPLTIAAANACNPQELLINFRAQRVSYYQSILAKHPDDERFRNIWLARASA